MKKTKFFVPGIFALAILLSTGCSKNNPLNPLGCANGTWAIQVSDELSDFSTAASNYSTDPSVSNCNAYKTAATNYLDALESVRGCVAGTNQANFNEAIDEAQEGIDETECGG